MNGKIIHRCGIKVLDGTESWDTRYTGFYDMPFQDFVPASYVYCTHFQGVNTGQIPTMGNRENKIWLGSNWIGLGARIKFSTVADFKQWLASQYAQGTPVIVVYPLAEPTEETVTPQPLSIQAGTNVITAEGSIDNLPLEVSYKAGVSVTITEVQNAQLDDNVEVIING